MNQRSFIAHCGIAARDMLMSYFEVLIVLSTVLRIERTRRSENNMLDLSLTGFDLTGHATLSFGRYNKSACVVDFLSCW
ncbi:MULTISPECIES: hypothetical protein [unclassified Bradyrhizobium]|uniref:hypothetical protein n=1 Tax=unclassified Bradyrhizobium TaxID=2631580 RepID=UPI00040ABA95|nr:MULTISPECIES: hypothetical protein [unclassified Bradyrhizobium]MCP3464629.1 hypothetical protein [Bradyrhizobium sp. CCGUVB23]